MSFYTFYLLAKGLGVSDFGTFTGLSIWAVVLAETGELGLQGLASQALVTRELSLRAIFRAKCLATMLGLLVCVASVSVSMLTGSSQVLGILVLFFLCAGWSELAGVALRARGRATAEAVVILALRASGLLFVGGLLVVTRPSVEGVAWAHVASTIPALALGSWLVRREVESESVSMGSVIGVLRRSAPLAVNGGLALVSLRMELLVLRAVSSASQTGIFALALRVIEFLSMVPSAVAGGAMPGLAREARSASLAVRRRTAWTLALLAGAASSGLALVAPGIVGLFGESEYLAAAGPMRILALAVVPLFANVLLSHSLVAAGRPERLPRLTVFRVLTALVLAILLAPRLGALGAAVGFLASELVLLFFAARACKDVRFPVSVLVPFGSGIGLALPMAAVVAWVGHALLGIGIATRTVTVVQIVAGIVTWAATLAGGWAWLRRTGLATDTEHRLPPKPAA